jgi:7-cyano-7-deazaguanine synthase
MKDIVCIYSGGMDSFTLVNDTHQQGRLAACLSFFYGQRHAKELEYAHRVCEELGVMHLVSDLSSITPCLKGSALTDQPNLPEGHYADDNMKQTVVPNRNMIMLSIAIAFAVSHDCEVVRFGAHSGDHTIYPDCRPDFVARMNILGLIANWKPVSVEAPYIRLDKHAILLIGHGLGLDYSKCWTCYAGREKACGKCGSCQERLEAFDRLGRPDPLEYETT